MPSCLGIYVEDNLIKYAKISQERDNIKIEAYGIKFYEDLEKTVKQIVAETYSYKTPISINIENEKYTYSNLFNLLNKKDLQRAIATEFDYFCSEKGKTRNAIEYREIECGNLADRDKINVLYSYVEKTNVVEKTQLLDGYKAINISPLAITISNLIDKEIQENTLILNIENKTEITTLVNGKVYRVDVIEEGMKKILENISTKENSQAKAYEICKNTTIYTSAGEGLQQEDNEYLVDIVPVLYNIVQQAKEIITKNQIEIKNIYLTGTGTAINNIDLYFQENFFDKKCEILTPYFIQKSNLKLNIKDYIEVNSAIALAIQATEKGLKNINFNQKSQNWENFKTILTSDVGKKTIKSKKPKEKINLKDKLKYNLNEELDTIEQNLIIVIVALILIVIVYIVFSKALSKQIETRTKEADEVIENNNYIIGELDSTIESVNSRIDRYDRLVQKIDEDSQRLTNWYASKNSIPNLLNEIMNIIPKEAQIITIHNEAGKQVVIEAQATEYQYLGYLKAKIQTEGILTDVVIEDNSKADNYVNVKIIGQLPY